MLCCLGSAWEDDEGQKVGADKHGDRGKQEAGKAIHGHAQADSTLEGGQWQGAARRH